MDHPQIGRRPLPGAPATFASDARALEASITASALTYRRKTLGYLAMRERMPTFTFRLPLILSRKVRALAFCYGKQPGPFIRDWLEAFIEGGLAKKLFEERLQAALDRYKDKPIPVDGGDSGAFTAPGQSVKAARKALKRGKGRKVK